MTQDTFEQLAFLFTSSAANRGRVRLDLDEAACLYRYAKQVSADSSHAARAVEIGRFKGGSTILLAAGLEESGWLLSIDRAPKNDEWLEAKLLEMSLHRRVELAVGDSASFPYSSSNFAPVGLDLVFVDGDHSYRGAKSDHMIWGRRLRPGGFIIHHDMAKTRSNATQIPDLARLREEILARQSSCVELVEEVGSISVFRRRGGCWKSWEDTK